MAELKVEGGELKKLILLGKKKPLNFGFCPGNKDAEHTFAIHRKMKPKMLGEAARKEGVGKKLAYGTFTVKGKVLFLTCMREIPTMAKLVKKYLKTQKLTMNVVILDESGKELESDVEPLPEDPEWDQAEANSETDLEDDDAVQAQDDVDDSDETDTNDAAAETAALAARLKAIQPDIAGLETDQAAKLKKAAAMAISQIKSGDLAKASATIGAVEGAITKLQATAPQATPEPQRETKSDTPTTPNVKTLAARATALKQHIADMNGPAAEKFTKALGGAVQQIKANDLAKADAMLTKIEAAANQVAASAPPADGAQEWAAAAARIQPGVDAAIADKRGDLTAINRVFNFAKQQAEKGDFASALKAAAKTEQLLAEAAEATQTAAVSEAEKTIPADVVPYYQSRLSWIKTRKSLTADLTTLKAEIDKATKGIEGLEEVSEKSGVLFDYLDDIDSSLEDTLEKLVETPDGSDREKLKSDARGIIAEYRDVLDEPFFKAVDNNGFASTNIRATALSSLQEVSAALS